MTQNQEIMLSRQAMNIRLMSLFQERIRKRSQMETWDIIGIYSTESFELGSLELSICKWNDNHNTGNDQFQELGMIAYHFNG